MVQTKPSGPARPSAWPVVLTREILFAFPDVPSAERHPPGGSMLPAAEQANHELVDRLVAEGALWSRPLIAAFRATPRHRFLDRVFQYQRRRERWREIVTRDP